MRHHLVPNTLGLPMDERRREHRGRTLRSGKILFNNKRSVIDCVVRNLSDGGACLQVNSTGGIPPSFELLVDGEAASRPCQLMWLSENRAGIEFREPDMAHDGNKASADHVQPSPAQSPAPLQVNSRGGAEILRGELLTVRAALDEVPVGIVLLDTDTRAQFINRAFRKIWRLPDARANSRPPFVALMYHGRDTNAYDVPSGDLDTYVAERVAHIKGGHPKPLNLRLANGEVI